MRIMLRELRRRPGGFVPVAGAMTLLVVLLVILGGFLDGLELDQTGAFRSQQDRLWTLSESADLQLTRSRVDDAAAETLRDLEGVASVAGIASLITTATVATDVEGEGQVVDVAVFGYQQGSANLPDPPPAGGVIVDDRLLGTVDLEVGDRLTIGPGGDTATVAGFVDDATQGAPSLWIELEAFRAVQRSAAPATALPEGVVQALVVTPENGAADAEVAARIDAATGTTTTVTLDELIAAQPVVAQQSATFQGIIAVTFVVVLLVVALFFALLILERTQLYAVLKALGARSGDLARGVIAQAVVIAVVALVLGALLSAGFVALLPADLPVRLVPSRVATIAVGTVLTAVLGVLAVLRRILRIDPARAIG
jgi:putative ABC transport system permease protein